MTPLRAVPAKRFQPVNELKIAQIWKTFLSYGKSDAVQAVRVV